MAPTPLEAWALPRLQHLLPLDEDSLKQIVTYADTLPKDAAADHLKNLLGDSGPSLEFITSFNTRRQRAPDEGKPAGPSHQQAPAPSASSNNRVVPPTGGAEVPRTRPKQKKKANIHALPPRQLEGQGNVAGAYQRRDVNDYAPRQSRQSHKELVADNLALTPDRPADAMQLPLITDNAAPTNKPISSKPPPSAAGQLISDALAPKKKGSASSTRTSSPAAKPTKVNITGGTAMHGASTALSDLDSAIRALEIQTNPSLTGDAAEDKRRNCNCMATRHPLLVMAPNCSNCGKIICVKQGLGPCTFCGSSLLSQDEIGKVLRVLKDERGDERMKANNAAHKKAEIASGKARAFTGREFLAQPSARSSPLSSAPASDTEDDDAGAKAKAHRDKLLNFQANNARRTQIHDEAADYDVPTSGTNMWASPQERAQQLKKQQRMMREMEWNARPEYEKRQVVASIDLKGGRIVKKMADVEKPDFSADEGNDVQEDYVAPKPEGGAGAFSNNPLLGAMIRPKVKEDKGKGAEREKSNTWRRVQMDQDDNEQWILDGGAYGGRIEGRVLGEEEHAFGS